MKIINGIVWLVFLIIFIVFIRQPKQKQIALSKKYGAVGLVLFLANGISFLLTFQQVQEGIHIDRDIYGGEVQQIPVLLEYEESSKQIELSVEPRELKENEVNKRMKQAFKNLSDSLKGQNESLSKVKQALDLSLDSEKYPFDVALYPKDYDLIDEDGMVRNEIEYLLNHGYSEKDLLDGIKTSVRVVLYYGDYEAEQNYEITIFPKDQTSIEKKFSEIEKELEKKEKNTRNEKFFELPIESNQVRIRIMKDSVVTAESVFVIGIILSILLVLRDKENKKQKEKQRMELLKRSYPWFVNTVLLYLGAGMQVKNIFMIMVQDYQEVDYRKVLIEELKQSLHQLNMGASEEQVYYELGRRIKLSGYIKVLTLLEQNVKRGGKGLVEAFEQEELLALEERKNLAKKYGEEAGTKLLGPMFLLLIIVMCMIMVPAFLSFSS